MDMVDITKICKAIGDTNRVEIIQMLMHGEMNATEILTKLQISQPTLSHHMKLLTDCQLVLSRRDKNQTIYSLNKEIISETGNIFSSMANGGNPPAANQFSADFSNQEIHYQNKLLSMAQEARRENEAKTDFLMRMSHDLRIPINGIKGMLLVSRKNLDNPENMEECISKMEDATSQLESLLEEILDMGEIENPKEILAIQSFNIFDNARELNNIYLPKAKKAGLSFKSEVIGEVKHPYIFSNRIFMKRLYQIILDNAIKYNKEDGSIHIKFQELSSTDTTTTHFISISDTGRGMSKDFVEHIFDPFDSAKNSGGTNSSGLGLSIVKRLIDRIGGKITIESELNEGTTVSLEITQEIDKKSEEVFANSTDTGINGKRILLVEDNELNLEVAKFILSDAGALVLTAQNGKEAVNIVSGSAEGEFDLILMDLMMPVMNGYAATSIIRSLERNDTKKIPIIAMSANAFDQDIKKSLESGMNEHISKPLNVGKVLSVLKRWL